MRKLVTPATKCAAAYHFTPHSHPSLTAGIGTPQQSQFKVQINIPTKGRLLSYPDAILYNDASSAVWFVEAVTSDGEIDQVKRAALSVMAERWGVEMAVATTCNTSWQDFLRRKSRGTQIAWDTSVWIAEVPGLLMHITAAQTL